MGQKTLKQGDLLTNLLNWESYRMNTSRGSLTDERVAPESTLKRPITQYEVKGMRAFTTMQLADKLDTRIAQKSEKSLVSTMGIVYDDHGLTFVWGAP